jgi:HAE1 family hydrophobic/amphiphilic exporter-1
MFEFGLVICVILFSSLVIAVTVVPLLASMIFTGKEKPKSKEVIWLTTRYGRLMEWTLRRPGLTIGAALLVLGVSLFLYTKIDREFLPPSPTRRIDFRVDIPPSYPLSEIKELFSGIEKYFLEHKDAYDLKAISTDFGKGGSNKGGRGRLTFFMKEPENSHMGTMEALQKIQAALPRLPGVAFHVRRMHGMSGREMGVSVVLKGDNLDVLTLIAEEVRNRLSQISGVKDVETSLESGEEEIQVSVNRTRANQYGMSARRVAQTIFSALTSRATSKFKTKDREVDIRIQLREADRANLEKLRNLTVGSEKKTLVPLYTMADFKKTKGPQQLVREKRRHVISVYANLERRGMYSATRAISGVLSRVELPPGYTWEFGKNYRRWRRSESQSWFVLGLSVVLILMVMASLFESILQPFVIIFSVPFAIIGILFFFWLTNTNLSEVGMLGVIIVFGLVVNNGIILIDHINHLRQSGMSRREAILKGGQNRLRPILMTAATTDLGLLPLILPIFFPSVFGPTEGRAGMWAPVGLAIFGGLTVSTFLTLIVLPAIYQVVDDLF